MNNIHNQTLQKCNTKKMTGYIRDGYCSHHKNDNGKHIVCAIMTDNFLQFSYSKGNDLMTPRKNFPGLQSGDLWCICVHRWIEAYNYHPSYAPYIKGSSTSKYILDFIPMNILKPYLKK